MINVGIIGAGMIAEKHAESLLKTNEIKISWVARRDKARLKEFQEKFNIPNGTVNYADILEDNDVDAVVITTPPSSHKKIFLAALYAQKHILLEKPAAITADEIFFMQEEMKKFPQVKVLDCSCRHSRLQPKFKAVKEIVNSGVLGDIYYIHHNSIWRQGRPGIEFHPTAKWFLNKEVAGGGCLLDFGVYDLGFHLGVLSDIPELKYVKEVMFKTGLDNFDPQGDVYDVEEQFVTMLEFTGGLKYYWERGNHANVDIPNETRIYGTRGGLKLGWCSWDANTIEHYSLDENNKAVSKTITVDMDGHSDEDALAYHFVDVLKEKAAPDMPLERAAKHLDIIRKIYASAE